MFSKQCNIDKTDRINRAVFGVILILAALFGMGKIFFIITGLVLIIEGLIGWCYSPVLMQKIRTWNTA
jgi:hypothetical protein